MQQYLQCVIKNKTVTLQGSQNSEFRENRELNVALIAANKTGVIGEFFKFTGNFLTKDGMMPILDTQ